MLSGCLGLLCHLKTLISNLDPDMKGMIWWVFQEEATSYRREGMQNKVRP